VVVSRILVLPPSEIDRLLSVNDVRETSNVKDELAPMDRRRFIDKTESLS
jgi:hypothetical protein